MQNEQPASHAGQASRRPAHLLTLGEDRKGIAVRATAERPQGSLTLHTLMHAGPEGVDIRPALPEDTWGETALFFTLNTPEDLAAFEDLSRFLLSRNACLYGAIGNIPLPNVLKATTQTFCDWCKPCNVYYMHLGSMGENAVCDLTDKLGKLLDGVAGEDL